MRPVAHEFASPEVLRTARHLAKLVREARLARRMPQAELALRARTSVATLHRIERGAVETSLGTWLSVMEHLGLIKLVADLQDPTSAALVEQHKARRARRPLRPDMDF